MYAGYQFILTGENGSNKSKIKYSFISICNIWSEDPILPEGWTKQTFMTKHTLTHSNLVENERNCLLYLKLKSFKEF